MTPDVERAYREHLSSGDLDVLRDAAGGQAARRRPLVASARAHRVRQRSTPRPHPRRVAVPHLRRRRAPHWPSGWRRRRTSTSGSLPGGECRCSTSSRCAACSPIRCGASSSSSCWRRTPTWSVGAPGSATRRGWRRRRFSELDPVQLAGMLEAVSPAERPGVLRRLGDLALFLTGVFPDHTASTPLGRPLSEAALLRSAGLETTGTAPGIWPRSSSSSCSGVVGTGSPPACRRRPAAPSRCSPRSPSSSPTLGGSSTPSPTSTSSRCASAGSAARPPSPGSSEPCSRSAGSTLHGVVRGCWRREARDSTRRKARNPSPSQTPAMTSSTVMPQRLRSAVSLAWGQERWSVVRPARWDLEITCSSADPWTAVRQTRCRPNAAPGSSTLTIPAHAYLSALKNAGRPPAGGRRVTVALALAGRGRARRCARSARKAGHTVGTSVAGSRVAR